MKRIKTHIIQLLFMACLICPTMSISAKDQKSIYDVKIYDNIIDIHHTPYSYDYFTGGFSDMGSWMCFTLPSNEDWVNGFCGPFDLDRRNWMSNAILQVGFTPNTKIEKFTPESTIYYPGELYMSSSSEKGKIEQNLFFIDQYTALWSCETDVQQPLYIVNGSLKNTKSSVLENNIWTISFYTGETYVIAFSIEIETSLKDSEFQAIVPKNSKAYATISYFYQTEKNQSVERIQSVKDILQQPDKYITEHASRWQNYLKSVLRPEMPEAYNRIAVKTVVTLLTNWRAAKGDLLHDGVIPSHAMDYFIGFWGWDSWKHAVALSVFAPELAKDQVRAMFDYQTPEGMIIDCIYTNKAENNARDSKPPLAAWAVNEIYKVTKDVDFVKEMFPKLLKYYQWWYQYRDNDGNGICEFGSVDGTLEAAAWESGMDNAIRFDGAKMVKNKENAYSVNQESVDLNAYLAYEYALLKELAKISGNEFNEEDRTAKIDEYFFDHEKGFFYDKRLSDRSFVTVEGCETYIPFWAKIATKEQADQSLEYFINPAKFGTYIPFPTVTADHPKFSSNGYWRGPIWLDQVYFGIRGLRNYGYTELANDYTKRVFDRLNGLREDAPIHENYDTNTGGRLKSPNFSWSAAHLLMLYRECDVINSDKTDLCLFEAGSRNFAYIKEVEFGTIHNQVSYSKTDFTDYSKDFNTELEIGKTYSMQVTASNWDSGKTDKYKLRLWIDWNGDYQLDRDELIDTKLINPIGAAKEEHYLQFLVTVPETAVTDKNIKFRLFLHFVENDTDGEDACGWVDSGTAQDYGIRINSKVSSVDRQMMNTLIYPNPVTDKLYIENDKKISKYSLYGMDGRLLFSRSGNVKMIDMSSYSSGSYFLKIDFVYEECQRPEFFNIVIK